MIKNTAKYFLLRETEEHNYESLLLSNCVEKKKLKGVITRSGKALLRLVCI